jgi:hypothetical protein
MNLGSRSVVGVDAMLYLDLGPKLLVRRRLVEEKITQKVASREVNWYLWLAATDLGSHRVVDVCSVVDQSGITKELEQGARQDEMERLEEGRVQVHDAGNRG